MPQIHIQSETAACSFETLHERTCCLKLPSLAVHNTCLYSRDFALTGIRLYLWAEGCEGHKIPEWSYIYGGGEIPAVNKHIQNPCSPNPQSISIH